MTRRVFVFFGLCLYFCTPGLAQFTLPPIQTTGLAIADRGGLSLVTDGGGTNIVVNYATIAAALGRAPAAAMGIFGLQSSGVLVSEVAISASAPAASGHLYAEISSSVDTGLAMANPNSTAAMVSFTFRDSNGTIVSSGTTVISPNAQITKFLDQPPFDAPDNLSGSFSFTATLPVSAAAFRGLTNERGEFLMSSVPLIDPSTVLNSAAVSLPHFASGGGWTTQVILLNTTGSLETGTIEWIDGNGKTLGAMPYSVATQGSSNLTLPIPGSSVQTGSIQVLADSTTTTPSALAVFSYKPVDVTVAQATVATLYGTAFRNYVFTAGTAGTTGSIQSAVAVANPAAITANVAFDLTALDGTAVASVQIAVPPNGQIARFVSDIFASQAVTLPVQGILRISTSGAGISVIGLRTRTNERRDFLITTTPPANEGAPVSTSNLIVPEIVNGGGYKSQFILFNGSSATVASADVSLANSDGSISTMPLYPLCTGIVRPFLVRRIEPEYTQAAEVAKITGTVMLSATINADGTVTVTGFINMLGYGLDQNAQTAIEQWRFCPATSNGNPVSTAVTIEVSFNLL